MWSVSSSRTFRPSAGGGLLSHEPPYGEIQSARLASSVAFHASQMFGRNVLALLQHLVKDGQLCLDPADEITGAMLVVHDGKVVR